MLVITNSDLIQFPQVGVIVLCKLDETNRKFIGFFEFREVNIENYALFSLTIAR